jgi:polyhydroxyalkanoate synthesis regulator phasin
MINWFLSILVNKGVLLEDEAKHLSQELGKTIHEHTFVDAHKTVSDILKEYKKLK